MPVRLIELKLYVALNRKYIISEMLFAANLLASRTDEECWCKGSNVYPSTSPAVNRERKRQFGHIS